MSNLQIKKEQQSKDIKELYPLSADLMRKKTHTELNLWNFKMHKKFLRFFFSGFSFGLYIPTFLSWIIVSIVIDDYLKVFFAFIIGATIEIGLAWFANDYFTIKYSKNTITKKLKFMLYFCAILSILGSSLSGINIVAITDNSETNIINKSRDVKKQDLDGYYSMLSKNDNIIKSNIAIINQNNGMINNLKSVALTKKGSNQINSFNTRNKELSLQDDKLLSDNIDIRSQIKNTSNYGNRIMENQLLKAGKKELIYMIVFFFAGILAVLAIIFSYDFMAKYHYYMAKEADDLEQLDELREEEIQNEITRKTRKDRILKESEIRNLELDKALNKAKSNTEAWEIETNNEKKKTNYRLGS
jgi:hypothetical protein